MATIRVSQAVTISAVKERRVPKGDVVEFSRAAALIAIKNTSNVVPDCHPIPIEHASVTHVLRDNEIEICVEVSTIYKTGVEVEAMHGAMIAALTVYDMLKPIDADISITEVCLVTKRGGKSDYIDNFGGVLEASVIVCSDSISAGTKTDSAGLAIAKKLVAHGLHVSSYEIIADEIDDIQRMTLEMVEKGVDLVVITGGTGLSERDVTPEAITPLLHRRIPGIEETIRAYGQQRTPYSMLSRSVVGLIDYTLVLALPGSTRGAAESIDAIFPAVLHIFRMMSGGAH